MGVRKEEEGRYGGRIAEGGRGQDWGVRSEEEGRYLVMVEGSEKN